MTIELFFRLLGSLALLIYGMKTMSDALQKLAGPSLRHILARMTGNRLSGMLTGTMVTCAVQSSSATTVMTVSFVSAGLLTLAQAISVIMGANIGTTLTAWIMSLGYNLDLTVVVFPAFLIGMVLIYKKRHRVVGDFLFGLALMLSISLPRSTLAVISPFLPSWQPAPSLPVLYSRRQPSWLSLSCSVPQECYPSIWVSHW